MKKLLSPFPLVGLALFLLVLLAGLLVTNSLGQPKLPNPSQAAIQSSSPTPGNPILSPTSSEEPVLPTSTTDVNPYPAPTDPGEPSPSPEPTVTLPPITSFPPPGPFQSQIIIYKRIDTPGYWINQIDGKDEQQLQGWWAKPENNKKFGDIHFQASPMTDELLFSSWSNMDYWEPETNSLWVMKANADTPLYFQTATEDWLPESPIWSPDGKEIAFRKTYRDKNSGGTRSDLELWVMDKDGSNPRMIFSDPNMQATSIGGELPLFRWAYNGYIYFMPRLSNSPLFALNPNTGQLYTLLNNADPLDWKLSLSPDGQHVRVSTRLPEDTIRKAGLTPVDFPDDFLIPKWSAGGKKVIFAEKDDTDQEKLKIVIKDLDSGDKKEVFKINKQDKFLGPSPDGRFVAFENDQNELYVLDLTTNVTTLITKGKTQSIEGVFQIAGWFPVP